jgi:hypothetical protein
MSQSEWDRLKFSLRDAIRRQDLLCKDIIRFGSRQSTHAGKTIESSTGTAQELKSDFDRLSKQISADITRARAIMGPSDTTRSAQLQRFQEDSIHTRRDWERQWHIVDSIQKRSELFTTSAKGDREDNPSEAGTLLNERSALMQSMGMIDSALESAVAADSMIREQNASLISFTGRLGALTTKVPFIHSLLGRIHSRQFQERIILGLVIGACLSIFLWMRVLT